jgi:hypothetical protein
VKKLPSVWLIDPLCRVSIDKTRRHKLRQSSLGALSGTMNCLAGGALAQGDAAVIVAVPAVVKLYPQTNCKWP